MSSSTGVGGFFTRKLSRPDQRLNHHLAVKYERRTDPLGVGRLLLGQGSLRDYRPSLFVPRGSHLLVTYTARSTGMASEEQRFFGELLERGKRAHRAEALQERAEQVVVEQLDWDTIRIEQDETVEDVETMTTPSETLSML
ncbi:hypothetical protein ACLOJK_007511 [Asimina triloba]